MNDHELDALMNDVLAEMANPALRDDFTRQFQDRSPTMTTATHNVLVFHTLGKTSGVGMSKRSFTTAALLNIAAALLLFLLVQHQKSLVAPRALELASIDAPLPPPIPLKLNAAGGGGGQKGPTPVTKGNPPAFAAEQLNPPKAPPTIAAKLSPPVTVDVQPDMKMAKSDVPDFGVANSPLVGMSPGNGAGGGLGSGNGNGIGAGTGGNLGGGIRKIGGGVSAPVVLYQPEPEFSEEARKAKTAGNVIVYLQVDAQGKPQHVRVLRGIGMGLDEKALAAVRLYRFKPAMENGHPVQVEMQVEVGFQIF